MPRRILAVSLVPAGPAEESRSAVIDPLDPSRVRGEIGRSLAAVLVTVAALAGIWAVVWFNVPRDLSRPMVVLPPTPPDLSDLIPPIRNPPAPGLQQPPSQAGDPAANAVGPMAAAPRAPETAGSPAVPMFSDQGPAIETALDCREEVRKLCGEIDPGSGRFRDCMERHRDLMPAACQRNLPERLGPPGTGARAMLTACRQDLRRWCPNIPVRGAPIIRCLREHAPDLSADCTEVLISERVL